MTNRVQKDRLGENKRYTLKTEVFGENRKVRDEQERLRRIASKYRESPFVLKTDRVAIKDFKEEEEIYK